MSYFYLFMAMVFSAAITIGARLYNNRNAHRANVSMLYNFLYPLSASLGWLLFWVMDFSFDARVLPYALIYGIGYSCFTIGMVGALKSGSTAVTALVKQLAFVGVSIWGFFFWDTQFTVISGIGLLLIVLSLSLCLLTKGKESSSKNTFKWAFYALLIFGGNATCSIIQRYQQMHFEYRHKNMLMFFGVFIAMIVCLVISLKEDKAHWAGALRSAWFCPAFAGLSSAVCNVFMLLLVKENISPVIMYPGIAVGGLMLTILVSLLFFRDKLRPTQWWGLAVGTAALVLLNL